MPTATENLSADQVWVLLERVRDSDEWRAVSAFLRALRHDKTEQLITRAQWMNESEVIALAGLAGEIRGIDAALGVIDGQETTNPPGGTSG